MSRQPGEPMRRLLALHEEWLKANGYPVKNTQSISEKKRKKEKTACNQFLNHYILIGY